MKEMPIKDKEGAQRAEKKITEKETEVTLNSQERSAIPAEVSRKKEKISKE